MNINKKNKQNTKKNLIKQNTKKNLIKKNIKTKNIQKNKLPKIQKLLPFTTTTIINK